MEFSLHRKSLRSLSSANEKWGQKQKWCIYNFGQCIIKQQGRSLLMENS